MVRAQILFQRNNGPHCGPRRVSQRSAGQRGRKPRASRVAGRARAARGARCGAASEISAGFCVALLLCWWRYAPRECRAGSYVASRRGRRLVAVAGGARARPPAQLVARSARRVFTSAAPRRCTQTMERAQPREPSEIRAARPACHEPRVATVACATSRAASCNSFLVARHGGTSDLLARSHIPQRTIASFTPNRRSAARGGVFFCPRASRVRERPPSEGRASDRSRGGTRARSVLRS